MGVLSQGEEAVAAEEAAVGVGDADEVAAGVVDVLAGHPGECVSGDGDGTDEEEVGEDVAALHSGGEVGVGEGLGVVEEAGEATGCGAAVGDAEEVGDAFADAGGHGQFPGGVAGEPFALVFGGDDVEDVGGFDGGDFFLFVAGGDLLDAGVEDEEDGAHGFLGVLDADVAAFTGEGRFIDEEAGEESFRGVGGLEGGEGGCGGGGGAEEEEGQAEEGAKDGGAMEHGRIRAFGRGGVQHLT